MKFSSISPSLGSSYKMTNENVRICYQSTKVNR